MRKKAPLQRISHYLFSTPRKVFYFTLGVVLTLSISTTYAAWNDSKVAGDSILATDWNALVNQVSSWVRSSTAASSNIYLGTTGFVGIGTTTPTQQLEITQNFKLPSTTQAAQYGVIYKGAYTFIHDFNYGNNGTVTTNGGNTFVGINSGNLTMGSTATDVDQASYNTGVGKNTLAANTTGYSNSAVGLNALTLNNTGYSNSAFGASALQANLGGYYNTAVGTYTLGSNTYGDHNTAVGWGAIYGNTSGNLNSAIGKEAGRYISGGSVANATSGTSTYLGAATKALADGDTNETVIGYDATGIGSNSVTLGNDSVTTTALKGKVGIGTTSPIALLEATTTSNAGANIIVSTPGTQASQQVSLGLVTKSDGSALGATSANKGWTVFARSNAWATAAQQNNFGIGYWNGTSWSQPVSIDSTTANVGINNATPAAKLDVAGDAIISGTSRYLNFGTTSGTTGYGIRDNAGVMEAKNSAGSWTAIAGGSGTVNSGTAGQLAYYSATGAAVSGSSLINISGSNVGVGTASPVAKLQADNYPAITANSASSYYGTFGQVYPNESYNYTGAILGNLGRAYSGANQSGTLSMMIGSQGDTYHSGSGTLASATGVRGIVNATATSGGNITAAIGVRSSINNSGAGTISSAYGLYAETPTNTGSGAITNYYGLYIVNPNAVATSNNYSIYSAGGANYLAGLTSIGSTYAGGYYGTLNVGGAGSPTSGYLIGASSTMSVPSTVTTRHDAFLSAPNTAAASFTLPNLRGFTAQQGTIGSGSTVTNQYGFYADAGLIGATNNYGFYGAIPSGTNRWNLYMAGTADNYLAGKLLIARSTASSGANGALQIGVQGATLPAIQTNTTSTAYRPHWTMAVSDVEVASIGTTNDVMSTYMGGALRSNLSALGRMDLYPTTGAGAGLVINSSNLSGATTNVTVFSNSTFGSAATTRGEGFQTTLGTEAATFNLGELGHFKATQGTIGSGSTVTNQYGFNASSTLTGATNNYGFYGDIASGTGRYNLYMNGTANNYLAGNLGIGVTSPTSARLAISGNATGATTFASVYNYPVVQSDVTSGYYGFRSEAYTQAASFTLPTFSHFYASQGTLGSSSAITSQYGYLAAANLTGATNNYGFYGNIPSGTGRYNLYMAGTADNYLAGNLGIGVAPNSNYKLYISGSGSNPTANQYAERTHITQTDTADNSNAAYPFYSSVQPNVSSGYTASGFQAAVYGSATVPSSYGGGTVTYLAGLRSDYGITGTGAGTVSNAYGLYASPYAQSGTVTNAYGVYISNPTTGGTLTNEYGIYQASSTAKNYFNGNTGIGTSTPAAKLDVAGDAIISGTSRYLNFGTTSGTTGYGIRDNAGAMEFKNSAGSWTALSGGSGTVNSGTANQLAYYSATGTAVSGSSDVYVSSGSVGIGTASPAAKLQTIYSPAITANSASNYVAGWSQVSPNESYNYTGAMWGNLGRINIGSSQSGTINAVTGSQGDLYHYGSGTLSNVTALNGVVGAAATSGGNITSARALQGSISNSGTGTITQAIGLLLANPINTGSGSITNYYGVYINNATTVATENNYSIYSTGGTNYLAGNIELGHLTDTTISRSSAGVLAVEGNNVLTTATGLPLAGGTMTGNLAMGTKDITGVGSIGATGARVTKGWFTDIESTNMPTVGGTSLSSTFAPIASPTFTTQITTPIVYGSSAADGDITINGTSSEVKTASYVILQPTGGNVGIGTTTPAAKLDVAGNAIISGTSRYLNFGTTSGTSGYGIRDNAGVMEFKNSAGSWVAVGSATGTINTGTQSQLAYYDDVNKISSASGIYASGGFLGVGTATPTKQLHIVSNTDQVVTAEIDNNNATGTTAASMFADYSDWGNLIMITHNSGRTVSRYGVSLGGYGEIASSGGNGLVVATRTAAPLIFGTNATNQMQISSAGDVGIGTTTPAAKLDVNGDVSLASDDSYVTLGNMTSQTGLLHVAAGVSAGGDGRTTELDTYLDSPYLSIGEYQNYLLQTEVFDNASWTKTNVTATANSAVSPIGTTIAENLTNLGGSQQFDVNVTQTIVNSATGDWTFSVWLKSVDATNDSMSLAISGDSIADIVYQNITVTPRWQRFAVTRNFSTATTSKSVHIVLDNSNSVAAWGAQFEPVSYVRPYSGARTTTALTTLTRTNAFNGALSTNGALAMAGALSGATTGGFSSTITQSTANLTTTPTNGLVLASSTASTVSVTSRISPRFMQYGRVWDTGSAADRYTKFYSEVIPTSGNPGTAVMNWGYNYGTSATAGTDVTLMSLSSAGNLSIGTSGNGYKLEVDGSGSNPTSSQVASRSNVTQTCTASNSNSAYGIWGSALPNVSSSYTASGFQAGILGEATIRSGSGGGTVSSLAAYRADYGILTGGLGTVTNAYGMYVSPYFQAGTVTNGYSMYLGSPATGGTITNEYGLYQASSTAKNYFAGNLGIGTTTPTAKLDVAGEVKFGNTDSTCNSTNEGQQRYNSTSKKMEFCNGTGWNTLAAGNAGITGQTIYNTAGTYTFTVPAGITTVKVTCVGGGGGSGGANTDYDNPVFMGGGGGGGTSIKTITGLTPGATVTVTVGAGGAAGSNTPSNGGTGGTSSFGSYVIAPGGVGSVAHAAAGGAGGNPTTSGAINVPGGAGETLYTSIVSAFAAEGGDSMYGVGGKYATAGGKYGGGAGGLRAVGQAVGFAGGVGLVSIEY